MSLNEMKMKNLILYYFAILLPIPLLVYFAMNNSIVFMVLLLSYAIYRGFVDGQRLLEKSIISKNEFWKAFIPFWCSRFYRQLYFEK